MLLLAGWASDIVQLFCGQLIQRGKPHAPCAHCATIICHTFPCNNLPHPLVQALVLTNV